MMFSASKRVEVAQQLAGEAYDVVVIGGGITGAGIALDASKRGMKVALIEMQDFAAGTSSRSTKLIHGGLRYLKQLQISVVKSSGQERAIVYENGPHVTTPLWMLLPFHKGGTFGPFSTSIGLRVYDYLAGVKKSERRKMLSREETIRRAPLVKKDGLIGSGYYVEYRTDDARLTIEVMKKAVEIGAKVLNYTKATSFLYDEKGKANGVAVEDIFTKQTFNIHAKKVINATGPWVDEVRKKDVSKVNNKHLRLTKGIHLVIDAKNFPLEQAVYFDTKDDKRMIFAVPRNGKTYVGTTDTVYEADKVQPVASAEDRNYLLSAVNYMFPTINLKKEHIESSWAGIRPLIWEEGKDPSEISRKDEIWESDSGLLTIAGGKLTGYRHMAEEVVDRLSEVLKRDFNEHFKPCLTKHEPISGGNVGGADHFEAYIAAQVKKGMALGLTEEESHFLARYYGTNSEIIFDYFKDEAFKEYEGLSRLTSLRLWYALNYESVVCPDDFMIRRTGNLFFNIQAVYQEKEAIIYHMAEHFGWAEEVKAQMTARMDQLIQDAEAFPEAIA